MHLEYEGPSSSTIADKDGLSVGRGSSIDGGLSVPSGVDTMDSSELVVSAAPVLTIISDASSVLAIDTLLTLTRAEGAEVDAGGRWAGSGCAVGDDLIACRRDRVDGDGLDDLLDAPRDGRGGVDAGKGSPSWIESLAPMDRISLPDPAEFLNRLLTPPSIVYSRLLSRSRWSGGVTVGWVDG